MRQIPTLFAIVLLAACIDAAARVSITVNPLQPGQPISEDFLGLSYETAQLLPGPNDAHYFSPENKPLVALFKTIGVKSLRIGGNSVDRATTAIPTEVDIDSLFAFARAAGVKVIYSVRLQNGDRESAARIAKYVHDHHAELLECFAIGNEPAYFKTYETYRDAWKSIADAMLAVAPGAKFCAPDTNPNPPWCKNVVTEFGKMPWFAMITEHDYPGGCSYKNPGAANIKDLIPNDPAAAREKMLSPDWYARYATVHQGMVDAVAGTSLPFRLSETNSLWYGGLEGASDSFASALWAVDYLHWWASHGARGLNFHTGDKVGGGDKSLTSRYTAFASADNGFDVRPLSYGMKLFDLAGHGAPIPIAITAPKGEELTAYATLLESKTVSVTLINKGHGADAAAMEVELKLPPPGSPASAQLLFLSAPQGDIAAKAGVTLGAEPIHPDGRWTGKWTPLEAHGDTISVSMPPAAAAVIQLQLGPLPASRP